MDNVAPILSPNKELMVRHLQFLFGRALTGRIEVTAIHTDKSAEPRPRTRFFDLDEIEGAADFASEINSQPNWNVYVGAGLRKPGVFPGQAADDGDFLSAFALWADADDDTQLASARDCYDKLGAAPPFVVVTGRTPTKRAQLWWPLETQISDLDQLRSSLRGIAVALGTDPMVCTGKQLMRMAGGLAWPKLNKPGRALEPIEIIEPSRAARAFPIEQISRAFPPATIMPGGQHAEITIEPDGALGLGEKIVDGREAYAFRLIRATLREWLGENGAEPTAGELLGEVAPRYYRRIDNSRGGRDPAWLLTKCREALDAFRRGMIPGMRSLDEAVETWATRKPEEVEDEGEDPAGAPDEDVFPSLTIAEIKALPDVDWVVDEIVPRGGLGFVYGAPGSFKSFVCYDLALTLAYGLVTWNAKAIKHTGSVLYLASEGATGASNRITAWQMKNKIEHDGGAFRLIRSSLSFMSVADIARLERTVAAIVADGGPVDTIFVDTVSRVLPGADENLQKDMTLFVAACDRLRERFGPTVIGVHHTNKNGDMRGSTVFMGQGDFIMRIEKDDDRKGGVLICEKQKEAEDGWRVAFSADAQSWMPVGRIKEVSSLTVTFSAASEVYANEGDGWPERAVCRDIQRSIEAAWAAGKPWSPFPQTKNEGRFAAQRIAEAHSLPFSQAKMVVERWLLNDVLVLEQINTHSKSKGLKVAKWID